ncbi:hypothetical protein, partial [Cronobacter sakazakii]|uniref:hypothetical protein n=1 Tax=Cronobacter sakazakii TaxID=28141 RepID=UPI0019D366D0
MLPEKGKRIDKGRRLYVRKQQKKKGYSAEKSASALSRTRHDYLLCQYAAARISWGSTRPS